MTTLYEDSQCCTEVVATIRRGYIPRGAMFFRVAVGLRGLSGSAKVKILSAVPMLPLYVAAKDKQQNDSRMQNLCVRRRRQLATRQRGWGLGHVTDLIKGFDRDDCTTKYRIVMELKSLHSHKFAGSWSGCFGVLDLSLSLLCAPFTGEIFQVARPFRVSGLGFRVH